MTTPEPVPLSAFVREAQALIDQICATPDQAEKRRLELQLLALFARASEGRRA